MAKFRTHYDNLNVSRNAPLNVIKAAYKALCQKYHPDKYQGGHEQALRIMKVINRAYAVLSDSAKRVEHDQWIAQQESYHASHEAQRIIDVIAKTYVAPAVTPAKNRSGSFSAMLSAFWKNIYLGGDRIRLTGSRLVKKSRLVFLLLGSGVLMSTIVIIPQPDPETASIPANQELVALLQKAERFVTQGQVTKALPLYLLLAGQGHADAQFQVGLLYARGQGIPRDNIKAVDWFRQSAEQGYRDAQTQLGYMYATGKGVAQSYSSAIDWCYKAAKQGDVAAQYNLGVMYAEGQGVAKDNSLAFAWYSKAAAQGDARSQYNLGIIYINGLGVAKDTKQAVAWYRKAARQGLAEAITALKSLDQ